MSGIVNCGEQNANRHVNKAGISSHSIIQGHAQQALAVDAASRPQDRGDFETRFRLDTLSDLEARRN